jgi:hypothetical protein
MAKADGNALVTKKLWAFVSDRRRDDMRQPKPFDQGQGAVTKPSATYMRDGRR